ncbi:hypothetical protein B0H34DRAFT_636533, partial [Crassisporium funariophilum]
MERTIGTLVEEIRQPSNPFQNISSRGVRRAQVNTLFAMVPDFDPPKNLPLVSKDLGNNYWGACSPLERHPHSMPQQELDCLKRFYHKHGIELALEWTTTVQKWARLRLPNEQIVRSSWKEKGRALQNVRISRNVMV